MSRGVRIRLMAFVVLSAVGITYITASYLGVVDRVTGRNITVTASLPGSGGLFEGSEVTYRGVKVGKVTRMDATDDGVDVTIDLRHDTRLPVDARVEVHNLSAVGEQYLDFLPTSEGGPYAEDGTRYEGGADSLPVDEGDLLVDLNRFVGSVDRDSLKKVVKELGLMFGDTGRDLERLLDGGSAFIEEAQAHTDETIALLDDGLTVLRTQRGQKENIRRFAKDLNTVTSMLRGSDRDLRTVLQATPGAARALDRLLKDLEPTLPVLLSDLITLDQVLVSELDGIEQLLVTYPAVLASGPTGSTSDGWGHVNLQLDYSVPPCTKGYLPPEEWRSTQDLTDGPIADVSCESGPPYVMRGTKYAPSNRAGKASPGRVYSGVYDPSTGRVPGLVDNAGNPVKLNKPEDLSVLGGDAWKWLLIGPVASR
ncbi:phospholipid/cholesterol/gamma-HCH transport system substrate-binding protein [Nocardioides sp. J9]|uniref:MCE family protein n=1 Tax=Nocardioides sp. J9 TaxID=935844 RepID=UPI00119F4216|nr:MlaD family protein [Nocardioides sp. J9]TWG97211.1 phospholipid/cholesterol/gamma-HCH transport system substrate-binding protein [Nocardioides sp. J9]